MQTVLAFFILIFCCLGTGCTGIAYRDPGLSMNPTITNDDLCVANPFAYQFDDIARFDLVVIKASEVPKEISEKKSEIRYIKRVIGLPNEKIEIKNNQIYINDKLIDEPFEKIVDEKDPKKDFPAIIIPENSYFLLGDNRSASFDSRFWKVPTVNKKDIYSKIVDIKKDYYKNR